MTLRFDEDEQISQLSILQISGEFTKQVIVI